MLISLESIEAIDSASTITPKHFGTVVKIGETDNAAFLVQGSHFDIAMDHLNIGSIRYPGGTEAVLDFDISNADDILGLKRAIDYCAQEGLSLNFTLTDLKYFYLTDGPIVISKADKLELKNFILNDLLGYAAQKGVEVESIRIGNEFLSKLLTDGGVSYLGQSAIGYGKNAAALVNYIDELFDEFFSERSRPDIVVESAGWVGGATRIIKQLKLYGAAEKVDAIDVHGASAGDDGIPSLNLTWDQYFGTSLSDEPGDTYQHRLESIIDIWMKDPSTNHVAIRMDAWAYPTDSLAGTALPNAGLGILHMHTYSSLNAVSATNYIAYGWDKSALILKINPRALNFVIDDRVTAAGQAFSMMSTALVGKQAIEIQGTSPAFLEAEQTILTRGFAGQGEVVVYAISRSSSRQEVELDLAKLISSSEVFVTGAAVESLLILGVEDQSRVNDRREEGFVESFDGSRSVNQTNILFDLDGYEIAQITLKGNGVYGSYQGDVMLSNGTVSVHGLLGNDFITGSDQNDTLAGGEGSDSLYGGGGDDLIFGGGDGDFMNGGAGNDTVSFEFSSAGVVVSLGDPERNTLDGKGDIIVQIENVNGSNFADLLLGNFQSQGLFGGDANDTLVGKGGDDYLDGGQGPDHLYGDSGNDTLIGGIGNDLLNGGIGRDSLDGGAGNDRIFGGLGNDWISGSAGDDTIFGGVGDDFILGGLGNDDLYLGVGQDTIGFTDLSDFGDWVHNFSVGDKLSFSKKLLPFFGEQKAVPSHAVLVANSAVSGLDTNDFFIFKSIDKTLWYDPDANGNMVALKVCQFDNFSGDWQGVIEIL